MQGQENGSGWVSEYRDRVWDSGVFGGVKFAMKIKKTSNKKVLKIKKNETLKHSAKKKKKNMGLMCGFVVKTIHGSCRETKFSF